MNKFYREIELPKKHSKDFYLINFDISYLLAMYSNFGNNFYLLKELLKMKIDVNKQDVFGINPLMMASLYSNTTSNLHTVKLLLNNNANVNLKNLEKYTPLLYACSELNNNSDELCLDTIKLLLKFKANVNDKTCNGYTPLMLVIYGGKNNSIDIIKLLLFHKANLYSINFYRQNSFDIALEKYGKNNKIYKLLINHKFYINDNICYKDILFIYN